jgi:hypothetical protein
MPMRPEEERIDRWSEMGKRSRQPTLGKNATWSRSILIGKSVVHIEETKGSLLG